MEEIGARLKVARETRKLSIKDVSKDTNISPIYLEALEKEEFDKLPGETYILGFLRAYSDYLKLDSDEITQYYRGFKIGESATPLEELTKPTASVFISSFFRFFEQYRNMFYAIGGAAVLAFMVWGIVAVFSTDIEIESESSIKDLKSEYELTDKENGIRKIRNLQLLNDRGNVLAYRDETVQFLVDKKEVMFILKDRKSDSAILEFLPGNFFETLEIEKPRTIELRDFSRKVILTLKGLTENRAKISVMLSSAIVDNTKPDEPEAQSSVVVQNRKNLRIVFKAEFVRKTYLEIYLDGSLKKKGLFQAGTSERWEAIEYIQLKIGNAGGLRANVNGKDYTFGLPGQVANRVITWKKDNKNPNLYSIVVKDW